MGKKFVSLENAQLIIDGLEIMDDEFFELRGGFAADDNEPSGTGCGCSSGSGCGCSNGSGCGCGCSSGTGCGCSGGTGCGCSGGSGCGCGGTTVIDG